jgi:hypothetical protein
VRGAFLGEPFVLEPVLILAVVVEQVLRPRLVQRRPVLVEARRLRLLVAARRHAGGRRRARRHAEVPVVGVEGRLRPVRLDAAALRGPVIGVPQAAVQPQVPQRRERHAARGLVLVHADRRAVDEHSANASNANGLVKNNSTIEHTRGDRHDHQEQFKMRSNRLT